MLRRVSEAAVEYADLNVDINNRIRLVTEGEERLAETREQLLDITRRTRGDLQDVAILYSRLSLALQGTEIAGRDIPRIIEIISKQSRIGGASATELRGGLIQLSQGFASGRLQGDELRSVFENLQGVTYGLTDGFRRLAEAGEIDFRVRGVGDLRRLAEQGLLTPEILARGFLASEEFAEERFAERAIGIVESFGLVRTELLNLNRVIEDSTGIYSGFAAAVRGFADDLRETAAGLDAFRLGRTGQPAPEAFGFRREDTGIDPEQLSLVIGNREVYEGRSLQQRQQIAEYLRGLELYYRDVRAGRAAPPEATPVPDRFAGITDILAGSTEAIRAAVEGGVQADNAAIQRLVQIQEQQESVAASQVQAIREQLQRVPQVTGEDGEVVGLLGTQIGILERLAGQLSGGEGGPDTRFYGAPNQAQRELFELRQAIHSEVPEIYRGALDPLVDSFEETIRFSDRAADHMDNFNLELQQFLNTPLGRFLDVRQQADRSAADRQAAERELNQREFADLLSSFEQGRERISRVEGVVFLLSEDDRRLLERLDATLTEASERNAQFLSLERLFENLPSQQQDEFREDFDRRRAANDQQLAQATSRVSTQFDRLYDRLLRQNELAASAVDTRFDQDEQAAGLRRQLEFLLHDFSRDTARVDQERLLRLAPEDRQAFADIPRLIRDALAQDAEFSALEARFRELPREEQLLAQPLLDQRRQANLANLERIVPLVTDAFEGFLDALRRDRDAIAEANRERIGRLRQTEDEKRAYEIRIAAEADARRLADRKRAEQELESAQQRRIQRLSSAFSNFFSQVFTQIDDLSDAFRALLQSISATFINEAITSVFASFGGARQSGGPVYPQNSYLIGERGPELFVPDTAGTILPNSSFGPSFAPTFQVTVTGGNAEDNRRMLMDEFLPFVREVVRQDWLDSAHRLGSPEYRVGGG
ncbi:MAG: tape measure protein [Caldilineaceae bacterium]|nr:tape measure protein [Caldilineaceae bacterium]